MYLIIEDNELNQKVASMVLSAYGEVTAVTSLEALAILSDEKYTAIFTGDEHLTEIRENLNGAKLVLIADEYSLCDYFIKKPVTRLELVKSLKSLGLLMEN